MKKPIFHALLCMLFHLTVTAQNTDLPYSSGSTGADGAYIVSPHPSGRADFAAAYDAARDEIVVFSGYNFYNGNHLTDTWVFDGTVWEQKNPTTFVPARRHHSMVYDPVSERVILFGGERADGVELNDMWSWDGNNWTAMQPDNLPPARREHLMAVNPANGHILIYGGNDTTGADLNDTWLWDGTDWSLVSETHFGYSYAPAQYRYMVYTSEYGWLIYDAYSNYKNYTFDGEQWNELASATNPGSIYDFRMVYDPDREEVILFGGYSQNNDTWIFRNGEWQQANPTSKATGRHDHGMVYDTTRDRIVTINGYMGYTHSLAADTTIPNFDTWAWDGTTWSYLTGRYVEFDMTSRADGVWNFTDINVPYPIEIRFKKNATNSPVVWKASGEVNIAGALLLHGEDAESNDQSANYAEGGPGGGRGGLGGIRFDVSGTFAGTPGEGPGGGEPGTTTGEYGDSGRFLNTYGNSLLQPLLGGSGGGGGASSANNNGGHGGGGGGAIHISSSRDIVVDGEINADGGNYAWGGSSYGGYGSGGAIRLTADRVLGTGRIRARSGGNNTDERAGRVRIEAYYRPLAANSSPTPSATAPVENIIQGDAPTLAIVSIDGATVRNPATGNPTDPDVIFSDNQTVTVVVQGQNVPAGTAVTLRITANGQIINLPAGEDPDVVLDGTGMATFSTIVPAGTGTVQAFAEFNQ